MLVCPAAAGSARLLILHRDPFPQESLLRGGPGAGEKEGSGDHMVPAGQLGTPACSPGHPPQVLKPELLLSEVLSGTFQGGTPGASAAGTPIGGADSHRLESRVSGLDPSLTFFYGKAWPGGVWWCGKSPSGFSLFEDMCLSGRRGLGDGGFIFHVLALVLFPGGLENGNEVYTLKKQKSPAGSEAQSGSEGEF